MSSASPSLALLPADAFAAELRAARPPEPYKGKGVRYRGEHIVRKQGKSFVGSE